MKDCQITDCVRHIGCGILDIIGKQPKNTEACSYYKSQAQADKKALRQEKLNQEIEQRKKKKPA